MRASKLTTYRHSTGPAFAVQRLRGLCLPILLFACLAVLLPAPRAAAAATAAAQQNAVPAFVLAYPPGGWPPYISSDGRTARGIYVDILTKVAQAVNRQLKTKVLPERRILDMLRLGEVDTYTKARAWVERPELYLWSDPLLDTVDVIMSRAHTSVEFENPGDLAGLRIGTVMGFSYPTLAPMYRSGALQRRDSPDSLSLIRKLALNRYDGVVVNEHIARHFIQTMPELAAEDFVFSRGIIDRQQIRLMFADTPEMRRLLPRINTAIRNLQKSGFIRDAVLSYCGTLSR